MDQNATRGLVNQIIYGIDQARDLTNKATAMRCADSIVNRRHFPGPPEWYAEAIDLTLRSGHLPEQTMEMTRLYTEAELLGFLSLLSDCLDELKPWPKPAFLKLDINLWGTFKDAKPIAKIVRPMHQINSILNDLFDQVPVGADKLPVMILELRSGDVVALIGSVEPRNSTFLLMPRDPGDSAALIARFCEYTGFLPQEVIPLSG